MNILFPALRRFVNDRRGSIIVPAVLMLPVVILGAGATIDLSRLQNLRSNAQSAADSAALATVREAALAGMTNQRLTDTAKNFARSLLGEAGATAEVSTSSDPKDNTVTVNINVKGQPGMGRFLGIGDGNVAVTATARLVGQVKICLMSLKTNAEKTLAASEGAKITGAECTFLVNSNRSKAISVTDNAKFTATLICSSGGFEGTSLNYAPMPKKDCPPLSDPLAKRPPPTAGDCTFHSRVIVSKDTTLKPGVYCGGLRIMRSAVARLDPGIYVMRDGALYVSDNATLQGKEVGFYFQGKDAQIKFEAGTTIDLSAPVSGQMAGLLFFEDRNVNNVESHRIYSNNAHTLLGTIYLPMGTLYIESKNPMAQKSAFTIIVAGRIEMTAGPELFLNTNYGSTNVPVPAGVGPVSGGAQLVR